jgi:AAA15 family ATPase/GTPase
MRLKSLRIKNFRVLEDFQVSKLGQVNLIVGQNNSGKSSVLEALQIYAGRASPLLLDEIAKSHDENVYREGERPQLHEGLPYESFFSGRKFPPADDVCIQIGDDTEINQLKIEHGFYVQEQMTESDETGEEKQRIRRKRIKKSDLLLNEYDLVGEAIYVQAHDGSTMMVRFDDRPHWFPRMPSIEQKSIPCSFVPTQFVSKDELADEWDKIGLTPAEDVIKRALQIISPDFEDIRFVRHDKVRGRSSTYFSRSAIVKLKNIEKPVPLHSMGDGIFRILQLFLKLFSAKSGFLLIDEFENGLHYSVQEKVWGLVFELSEELNVQVFATTHSWDCIESFAKVAVAKKDTQGVLFRVGRSVKVSDQNKVIATVFDEEKLLNVTQSDLEVR